jgi:hypothetical protein
MVQRDLFLQSSNSLTQLSVASHGALLCSIAFKKHFSKLSR